jgi:hypothetical protein
MERKDFIKTGFIAAGGLVALPSFSHIIEVTTHSIHILKENRHIRHGYYGKEFINNLLNTSSLKSARIDRFENPEGNLLLFDLELAEGNVRIAMEKREFLIQSGDSLERIDKQSLKTSLHWLSDDRLALTHKPRREDIPTHTSLILFGEEMEEVSYIHHPNEENFKEVSEYALIVI